MTREQIAALAAILLLAAIVRFHALGREPLWRDEQGQLAISQSQTFSEFWSSYVSKHGGPIGRLSYVDTWLAVKLGASTRTAFRIPAALWGVAAIFMTFVLGRRWFSISVGLFAAALMSVHALHVQYSQEARGYSLLVFVMLLFVWALDRVLERLFVAGAIALGIVAVAGVEVHPVFLAPMWLVSLAATLWLMRERGVDARPLAERKATIAAMLGSASLASVVFALTPRDLPVMISNVAQAEHSLPYHLADIHKSLVGGYWGALSYVIFVLACAGLFVGLRSREFRRGMLLACAIAVAASAPIVLGYLRGTWVVSRYSIFALPFFMYMVAVGFDESVKRATKGERASSWIAVALPFILIGGMMLQQRSIYDLEKIKQTDVDPALPGLPE